MNMYELVLRQKRDGIIILSGGYNCDTSAKACLSTSNVHHLPALLTVNRQVHNEAIPFLYMNKLCFPDLAVLSQFVWQTVTQVPLLQHIAVASTHSWTPTSSKLAFGILASAKSLHTFEIGVSSVRKGASPTLPSWWHSGTPSRFQVMCGFLTRLGRERGGLTYGIDVLEFARCKDDGHINDVCHDLTRSIREELKISWGRDLHTGALCRRFRRPS